MFAMKLLAGPALALILASPLAAQEATDHSNHSAPAAAPAGDTGPSSRAFVEANNRMHKDMAIEFTGNADVDFVRGMIAHHQGAIDMARVELEYGKDPEIRKLADEIIRAQEGEIALMKEWLEKNAK
ncbi:DUF305 domain-containing protein [Rhizobiaceae bacterium n13]|uniref:DUF305 domain-containing protein n=1 Tax=Ferirhizobium litorale TaxID=2927786 RepID=A0AAE3QBA3_9HYPH|nr:DUF305 domain-containing protein [Fererhizobium litorale]MDI7864794.1 DUF305 domain-containing protein [Fererhizobium litorale]MDI7921706.1 DUF305 domain-containing protein [Fererhizobium litorale]